MREFVGASEPIGTTLRIAQTSDSTYDTTSFARTMAVEARVPETTGQTYHRYSPGTKERVLLASFQCGGTVSAGRIVFAENASAEPLKNSMWYPDAPRAGAQAKRRALGFGVLPALPLGTRLPGSEGTGVRAGVMVTAGAFSSASADAGVRPT